MADGKALELKEGARIDVSVTVYEDIKTKDASGRVTEGKTLHDANGRKVQTRAEDGQRFVRRVLMYPFPAGLIDDPLTGKKAAENMTAQQIGHALNEWLKEVEALKANGGRVSVSDGKDSVTMEVPIDVIPTPAETLVKGFKLEIQGPVNQQLVKDHVTVIGGQGKAKSTRGPLNLSSLG